MSSSGFQTLGTPSESYLNLSSNTPFSFVKSADSEVCSSILDRSASHDLRRKRASAEVFSSSVQLKPKRSYVSLICMRQGEQDMDALVAFLRYASSAFANEALKSARTLSHMSAFGSLRLTSTTSATCFLMLRYTIRKERIRISKSCLTRN